MSLVKNVLDTLSTSLVEGQVTIGEVVYHPYKALYGDLTKIYKQSSVDQAIYRAKKNGLIKKRIINEKSYIAITEFGKQKGHKPEFNIEFKNEGWDGKYRVVFFDIPEVNRVVRNALRNKLKKLGFIGWQQSVFVGKNNITKGLKESANKAGFGDYIMIIETKDLGDNKLKTSLEGI